MLDKIEALRKEPKAKRSRVAFMTALVSTSIIALVWGISLPSRLQTAFKTLPEEDGADTEGVTASDRLSVIRDYFNENLSEVETQAELLDATSPSATSTETEPVFMVSTSSAESPIMNATSSIATTSTGATSSSTTIPSLFQ